MYSLYLPFFFFIATATTEIYTLSLHDALPICRYRRATRPGPPAPPGGRGSPAPRRPGPSVVARSAGPVTLPGGLSQVRAAPYRYHHRSKPQGRSHSWASAPFAIPATI